MCTKIVFGRVNADGTIADKGTGDWWPSKNAETITINFLRDQSAEGNTIPGFNPDLPPSVVVSNYGTLVGSGSVPPFVNVVNNAAGPDHQCQFTVDWISSAWYSSASKSLLAQAFDFIAIGFFDQSI